MAADQKKHENNGKAIAAKVGAILLTVLIAGAFALEPVIRSMNNTAPNADETTELAFYKDTPVSVDRGSRFYRAYQNNLAVYRMYYGNDYVEQNIFGITQTVLQNTIMEMARLEELAKVDIPVSKERIAREVRSYPEYQVDGRYNIKKYQNTPEALRKKYIDIITEQIMFNQFDQDMMLGYTENEAEKEFMLDMISDQRSIRFVTFQYSDYPEELVVEYGKDKADLFQKAQLSSITVDTLDNANNLKAELTAQNFLENPNAQSTSKFKHQMELIVADEADINEIFALSAGAIAGPFKTKSEQYIIYKLDAPVEELDFENNIIAVRNYIQSNDASLISDYFEAKADSFIADAESKGFSLAAASEGIEVKSAENIIINAKNFSGFPQYTNSEMSIASSDEDFLVNLFSASEGSIVEPVLLGSSIMVAEVVAKSTTETAELATEYASLARQMHFTDSSRVLFNPDNYSIDQNKLISLIYN